MEDGVTFETLNKNVNNMERPQGEDAQTLRRELITLAEKNEIKHSVAYIKKVSHSALEKIKGEYERKQLEETNEYLTPLRGRPRSKTFLTQQVTKEKLSAIMRGNRDHALLLRPKNYICLILSWC